MKKDLDDCADLIRSGYFSSFEQPDPLRVRISFRHSEASFSVQVPRFYPSKPPVVYIDNLRLQGEGWQSRLACVEKDGRVNIPILNAQWVAIYSMRDVFNALEMLVLHVSLSLSQALQ